MHTTSSFPVTAPTEVGADAVYAELYAAQERSEAAFLVSREAYFQLQMERNGDGRRILDAELAYQAALDAWSVAMDDEKAIRQEVAAGGRRAVTP
jgi:hypothetical protein